MGLLDHTTVSEKNLVFFSLYCPIHHARNAQLVGLSPRFFQIHFYPQLHKIKKMLQIEFFFRFAQRRAVYFCPADNGGKINNIKNIGRLLLISTQSPTVNDVITVI